MKTRSYLIILAFTLILILLLSCQEATVNPWLNPTNKISDFPNEIGNEWTYCNEDSVLSSKDTVIIRITGDTLLPNNHSAKIWQTLGIRAGIEYVMDTTFIWIVNDTVFSSGPYKSGYYDDAIQEILYVFPLNTEKIWNQIKYRNSPLKDVYLDTVEIKTINILVSPAGRFNTYSICYYPSLYTNFVGNRFVDFALGIGEVRFQLLDSFNVPVYTYYLINYKLVNK